MLHRGDTVMNNWSVIKRDGKTIVPFDLNKIKTAISKAMNEHSDKYGVFVNEHSLAIAKNVVRVLEEKYKNQEVQIHIEEIQDIVETAIMNYGFYEVAKSFILYRFKRHEARDFSLQEQLKIIDEYIGEDAWEVRENSNMDYSLQGLNNHIAARITKNYWMNKVYPEYIGKAAMDGDMHIHDAGTLASYCCGWDLRDLLLTGFGGVKGTNVSNPAKHFETALGQIWNFLYTLQGESAGAQSFSNFDTYLAPFVKLDNLTYEQVEQCMQQFMHNMTVKTRVGFQTPFSNLSMDLTVPKYMEKEACIVGGKLHPTLTYGDCQKEMDMINKAFCEVNLKGDGVGRPFSFPIPNYNITKDFDWDNPDYEPLWRLAGKYGSPYFTNLVNSDMKPEDIRSMCPFHPEEHIHFRMKVTNEDGSYTYNEMTWPIKKFYDLFLNNKAINSVTVKYLDKWIPVKRVLKFKATGFLKIKTTRCPDGVVMEYHHLQPVKYAQLTGCETTLTSVNEVIATAIKPNITYLPYAVSDNNTEWFKVTEVVDLGTDDQEFAYCIEVDSEDHLFELSENGFITHNCRLRLDNTVLRKRGGGLFGANPLTGSIGVVTINLPRIGYLCKGNKEAFYERLDKMMDIARDSLIIKRKFIENRCDQGFYPFSKFYLRNIKERFGQYFFNHFSTIGLVGGNECCLNFMGKDIVSEEGHAFMCEVLDHMRERMTIYQDQCDGIPFNLESSPAEGASYALALKDIKKYPNIITATTFVDTAVEPYYTNSTQLPVDYTDDIFETIRLQEPLQVKYTGGTVVHLYLGEEITDPNAVKDLIKTITVNSEIPYVTLSPIYSICQDHGYIDGKVMECPKCGKATEVYQRVVGFYTPLSRWHKGKQEESKIRKSFNVETAAKLK
jgi:ribonucleoside-triphosphate reductase